MHGFIHCCILLYIFAYFCKLSKFPLAQVYWPQFPAKLAAANCFYCSLFSSVTSCTWVLVLSKLQTAHCTLNTARCTNNTAQCTVYSAQCTLHPVPYTLYNALHGLLITQLTCKTMSLQTMQSVEIEDCKYFYVQFLPKQLLWLWYVNNSSPTLLQVLDITTISCTQTFTCLFDQLKK